MNCLIKNINPGATIFSNSESPKMDLREEISSSGSNNSKDSLNGSETELKNFILREAPPPRQNLGVSAISLSAREASSSPIV